MTKGSVVALVLNSHYSSWAGRAGSPSHRVCLQASFYESVGGILVVAGCAWMLLVVDTFV